MLDLLRIVDDGAAGRHGGHLRTKMEQSGENMRRRPDSLKHGVWAMCIVKWYLSRLLLYKI